VTLASEHRADGTPGVLFVSCQRENRERAA
jgi:hypothetical protein